MGHLESDLMAIERTLRYLRLRENKGFSLVDTTRCADALTRKRIVRYSIFEVIVIICISVGQVLVVRALFNKNSGSRIRV